MPRLESGTAGPTAAVAASIDVPKAGGKSLEPSVQHLMERRIGHDFSRVRVHRDEAAVQSSRQLGAHAYTVGHHVYFNAGQHKPASFEGRRLLAHELTHVVQQTNPGNMPGLGVQRQPARRPGAGSSRARRSSPQCVNECAGGACPQGKQRQVVRNDCSDSPPVNQQDYITALHVSLGDKTVKVMWWAEGFGGYSEVWPCSPNPSVTPRHSADQPEFVAKKCSINHTNRHRDGMAWLTAFQSTNVGIGFHDSQHVGPACVSHGCVRVCCDKAEIINKNT
ncbi:MAG TPA: DUF4157 domain-containing protein [Verrucomicrobiae bacterium]